MKYEISCRYPQPQILILSISLPQYVPTARLFVWTEGSAACNLGRKFLYITLAASGHQNNLQTFVRQEGTGPPGPANGLTVVHLRGAKLLQPTHGRLEGDECHSQPLAHSTCPTLIKLIELNPFQCIKCFTSDSLCWRR